MADNKDRIYFGSLEAKEKERLEAKGRPSASSPSGVDQPGANVAPGVGAGAVVLPFSAAALESVEKHNQKMQRLELHRRARSIVVPTNDEMVKLKLREIKEPIILFGEKPEDRRERLREHLARLGITDGFPAGAKEAGKIKKEEKGEPEESEAYYTEGVPELKATRLWIASYSIPKAKSRIASAKRKREQGGSSLHPNKAATKESLSRFWNSTSEIGDERPLVAIGFAPNSRLIATGAWSGLCKFWEIAGGGSSDLVTCRHTASLRGHTERIHDLAFHPRSTLDLSPTVVNFATCSSDRTTRLWSLQPSDLNSTSSSSSDVTTTDQNNNNNNNHNHTNGASSSSSGISYLSPLATLNGHEERVNGVDFHPSGRYVGTCSSDRTWRLWDLETNKELLCQDGHSRAIHAISFQVDGSLVATGGEDNSARVWDLRSGRPLWSFQGHVKQIVDMDWAPNGYQLASSSDDHSVRIWDLRKRRNVYVLPAHSNLISTVRYQQDVDGGGGDFLLTASFDNTCKIWDTTDWTPIKTLAGHEGRIMAADISPDSKYIASAAYDRTWKLWCDESEGNNNNNIDNEDNHYENSNNNNNNNNDMNFNADMDGRRHVDDNFYGGALPSIKMETD